MVHRRVRVAQRVLGPLVLLVGEGDAGGGRHEHVLRAQREGLLQGLFQRERRALDLTRVLQVLDQDREVVASQARDRVARPHDPAQHGRQLHQQPVAGGVAQALVDELEAVEVHEQHGAALLRAPAPAGQRAAQAVHEERAVRQPGEAVVEGVVLELLLRAPALGDVRADRGASVDRAREVVEHGVVPGDEAALAVERQHLLLLVRGEHAGVDAAGESRPGAVAVLQRYAELEPVVADHVLLGGAQQLQQVRVRERDHAVAVHQHGRELDVLQHVAQAPLGLARGQLGQLLLGDVEGHAQQCRPALPGQDGGGHVHPALLPRGCQELDLVARRRGLATQARARPLADQVLEVRVHGPPEVHAQQLRGRVPGEP